MNREIRNLVLVLAILICLVSPSDEKAVPEDSNIIGYEYTYNRQNGQYEVRPVYEKQNVVTSTVKPEQYHNPESLVDGNNGEPIFLPPIGKLKSETNKILKEYYGSKNKLNFQFKGMEVSKDYSTSLDYFTQNWTPEYLTTREGYDNEYYKKAVISSRNNFRDASYQNEGGLKFKQSNLNDEESQLRKRGDKVKYSQKEHSADYPDKQTKEFEDINFNEIKYKDKSTLSQIEKVSEKNEAKYYMPTIREISSHRSGSKGKRKKIKKYEDYDLKLVNLEKSIKPENKFTTPEPMSTNVADLKVTPFPQRIKGYNSGKITSSDEQTKQSEDHETEYLPEIKDKNLDSFTEKEKECKDIKSKSNKDDNAKSCSENSDSSEPEMYEYPKIVSIKTSDVKMPVTDGYDVNKKDYENDRNSDFFTVKKKECKDTKSKSNENGNMEGCSENSDSSQPETDEYPKIVSIKTSDAKLPAADGYDVKEKGYENGKNSDFFTVKKKECKDSKSNKDDNVKSCSENSDSSEPEMYEYPKIVSIKTSDVKLPVVDEYDIKDNKNLKDFPPVIKDISDGINPMNRGENHANFRDVSDECNDKFIELINSGDASVNQLGGQCQRNNIATEIIPHVPDFSEVDDKFRSLSSLNSNIWSLIFNPNAKDRALQKCITRKNETGHCMYIQNCLVPNIANSLEELLNNACVMDEVFIGICCPEFPVETVRVQWEQPEKHSTDIKTEDEFRHDVEDCGTRSKEASEKNVWPWKAPLVSMSNGKIFCGGVIISERYILTAAHCTTRIPKNQILVRLGQDELLGSDIPVTEIKRHAQYNPRTMQNDIALLKLDRRISHADEASSSMICLPEESDSTDSHAGDKAVLLGWQGVSGVNQQKTEILEIMSNEECRRKLNANAHHSLLCTEARNEDERTCNADSGAPLVIEEDDEYEVVGILSWNRNDCDPRFPSTFSRVSSYLGWIRRHAT